MSVTELAPPAAVLVAPTLRERAAGMFAAYGAVALRVSLGLVLLGFGALKFFPGASPAEALVMRTVDALTFGLISGTPAVAATAVVETIIGLTLITGVGLRFGVLLLFPVIAGMMSPLVLFPGDMFPGMLPTLEAQYILKDVILAAAAMVVAGRALHR
ncbi:DoxX family membrane protein [Actinoplanes sp. NPDC024001]|uniref:DoxX family membrane protein n=1 Tax=Actinoplanes sp. NPDC024001 TaxID=3154598 RepID=UPI0033DD57A6